MVCISYTLILLSQRIKLHNQWQILETSGIQIIPHSKKRILELLGDAAVTDGMGFKRIFPKGFRWDGMSGGRLANVFRPWVTGTKQDWVYLTHDFDCRCRKLLNLKWSYIHRNMRKGIVKFGGLRTRALVWEIAVWIGAPFVAGKGFGLQDDEDYDQSIDGLSLVDWVKKNYPYGLEKSTCPTGI